MKANIPILKNHNSKKGTESTYYFHVLSGSTEATVVSYEWVNLFMSIPERSKRSARNLIT
jgi:hypothetical protein